MINWVQSIPSTYLSRNVIAASWSIALYTTGCMSVQCNASMWIMRALICAGEWQQQQSTITPEATNIQYIKQAADVGTQAVARGQCAGHRSALSKPYGWGSGRELKTAPSKHACYCGVRPSISIVFLHGLQPKFNSHFPLQLALANSCSSEFSTNMNGKKNCLL